MFVGLFGLIALLMAIEWGTAFNLEKRLMQRTFTRWILYYAGLASIVIALLLIPPGQPFIYFRF
jgi:hypothetical protein